MIVQEIEKDQPTGKLYYATKVVMVLLSVLFFLLAIDLMDYAFESLRQDMASSLLLVTTDPFIGLFVGLLLTALIQSSSTSTSMIVALVGANTISLSAAVPLIMGANIGTTLTSTVVSLGYITSKREFRKALSAGIVHDIYNIILIAILFPLEYYYGLLSHTSEALVAGVSGSGGAAFLENISLTMKGMPELGAYLASLIGNSWVMLVLSFILLFASIKMISSIIYSSLIGSFKNRVQTFVFRNSYRSFAWGGGLTAAVQSSSVTTSLIVPLVATGKVSLSKAFPFIIGANLGTTLTALIAAVSISEAAIGVAMVHLLINLIGVVLFLPFRPLRNIPVTLATLFGKLTLRHRIYGFLYIVLMFFIIPFILIYLHRGA